MLTRLESILRSKELIERDVDLTPAQKRDRIKDLKLDGCPVQDLDLDFTLAGYDSIELRKGGKDIPLTIDNLEQYIKASRHLNTFIELNQTKNIWIQN